MLAIWRPKTGHPQRREVQKGLFAAPQRAQDVRDEHVDDKSNSNELILVIIIRLRH